MKILCAKFFVVSKIFSFQVFIFPVFEQLFGPDAVIYKPIDCAEGPDKKKWKYEEDIILSESPVRVGGCQAHENNEHEIKSRQHQDIVSDPAAVEHPGNKDQRIQVKEQDVPGIKNRRTAIEERLPVWSVLICIAVKQHRKGEKDHPDKTV